MGLEYNQITPNVITTAPKNIDEITDMDSLETVSLTCINLPRRLIIVDCGAVNTKARTFRSDMERHFKKDVSHLLLTHSHWDHSDALEVFRDATIVISKKGAAKIHPRPDIKVTERFLINSNRNKVIFQVTGGHSPDSAYVFSPLDQVLCAGDNLLSCYSQVFTNGKVLLDVYRHWESLDVRNIVPGHGFVVDKKYLTNVRKYFERLISYLAKLKSQGLTIHQVLKHSGLPAYCYRNHSKWEEGGRRHTGWLTLGIKYWYRII
ncbi:MAG: MBL fold metallo-hydrolase [Candidatus Hodarchaeota archaeon]